MISFNEDLSNSIVAKGTAMMWNSIFWRTMTSPTLSPSAFGLQELWNEDECSKFQRLSRTMFDIKSSAIVSPRIILNGLKCITCPSEPISVPMLLESEMLVEESSLLRSHTIYGSVLLLNILHSGLSLAPRGRSQYSMLLNLSPQ